MRQLRHPIGDDEQSLSAQGSTFSYFSGKLLIYFSFTHT